MRDVNTLYRTCIYNRLSEDEPSDSKRVQDIVKIKILFIIHTNKFTTYIHEQYFTYSKHCYMFRYIFIIFRQCYPSTVIILQISFRLQTQYNQYIKMFTYVIVTVDDKIQSTKIWAVNCCNYSTWKLLAWWLYIQSGPSYRCEPYFGVSCVRVCNSDF